MPDITLFTAMTKLQVVKDGVNRACFGIEADDKNVNQQLETGGDFCALTYLNTIAAGVAAVIQTCWNDNPEEQAAYVQNFFQAVEQWIELGIEMVEDPEILQQPGSPG